MVAHLLPKQRAAGSNPVSRSTTKKPHGFRRVAFALSRVFRKARGYGQGEALPVSPTQTPEFSGFTSPLRS